MGFLQKHAEKVLFAALLVGLVASIFLVLQMSSPSIGNTGRPPPSTALPKYTAGIDSLLASISGTPPSLAVVTNSFTSSSRKVCINPDDQSLIPLDAMVCPFCGFKQEVVEVPVDTDKGGIPDDDERLWGMNPNDASDEMQDQDKDGFPALYEYQHGTSDIDPNNHPALITFLRLDNVIEKRMLLELRGTARLSDTAYTLQLFWQYPGETQWESDIVRTGSTFGRTKEFLAEKFTEKRVLKDTRYVDESFATIRSGRHELQLRLDKEGRQGSIVESTATLKLIFGPTWTQEVRMGQTFELDKISYKVIDIRRDAVVIQSGTLEPITVTAPTAEELEALKPPATTPEPGTTPEDLGFDPATLQQIMNQGR
jgi:hypothetical protein